LAAGGAGAATVDTGGRVRQLRFIDLPKGVESLEEVVALPERPPPQEYS